MIPARMYDNSAYITYVEQYRKAEPTSKNCFALNDVKNSHEFESVFVNN